MENIKEQFARLYMELYLTDDQAAMIKKLQRDVEAALRQQPVSSSATSYKEDCMPKPLNGDYYAEERWKGW